MSGVSATARIAGLADAPAVLVVTMVDDDDTVLAALKAGARGYVLKGATGEDIAAAVRTVARGGAVFGAGVAVQVLAMTAGRPPPAVGDGRRSDRPGARGAHAALRRLEQHPDCPNARIVRENRAELRVSHPQPSSGHRPHASRPYAPARGGGASPPCYPSSRYAPGMS